MKESFHLINIEFGASSRLTENVFEAGGEKKTQNCDCICNNYNNQTMSGDIVHNSNGHKESIAMLNTN